jgi:hypothetical protein
MRGCLRQWLNVSPGYVGSAKAIKGRFCPRDGGGKEAVPHTSQVSSLLTSLGGTWANRFLGRLKYGMVLACRMRDCNKIRYEVFPLKTPSCTSAPGSRTCMGDLSADLLLHPLACGAHTYTPFFLRSILPDLGDYQVHPVPVASRTLASHFKRCRTTTSPDANHLSSVILTSHKHQVAASKSAVNYVFILRAGVQTFRLRL